jgi:hypothetical protein
VTCGSSAPLVTHSLTHALTHSSCSLIAVDEIFKKESGSFIFLLPPLPLPLPLTPSLPHSFTPSSLPHSLPHSTILFSVSQASMPRYTSDPTATVDIQVSDALQCDHTLPHSPTHSPTHPPTHSLTHSSCR